MMPKRLIGVADKLIWRSKLYKAGYHDAMNEQYASACVWARVLMERDRYRAQVIRECAKALRDEAETYGEELLAQFNTLRHAADLLDRMAGE